MVYIIQCNVSVSLIHVYWWQYNPVSQIHLTNILVFCADLIVEAIVTPMKLSALHRDHTGTSEKQYIKKYVNIEIVRGELEWEDEKNVLFL